MTNEPELLQTLEYVAATLKLRHIDEATDDEVEEALTMAQEAIVKAKKDRSTTSLPASSTPVPPGELPGLIHLPWDFIENGKSSYGLDFFTLRERMREAAREAQHTRPVPATKNPAQVALQAVLPYAENELASLQESHRRDGGLENEITACEAAVAQARAAAAQPEQPPASARRSRGRP